MKDKPLVSVVVVTKNAEETLRDCLESIRKQTYLNIELIVVDNYSTDRSREIAKEYGAEVYVKGPERSAQLNYGGKMAKGEFVYFMGSDIVLTPRLIEECVKIVGDGCDAVIVWNVSDPSKSVWAKTRFYERLSYYGSGVYEGARFVRRDMVMRVGGFDEDIFANEDIAFGRKLLGLGARIGRTRHNYELHIGEPRTLKEIVLKSYYYGGNIRQYFRKYSDYRYALPIRPTFFKRKFIKKLLKEWPQGLLLIPFLKMFQSVLYLIGLIAMSRISPYEKGKE
jgi:glycosyltransferase involved in cell wall biosynthesis